MQQLAVVESIWNNLYPVMQQVYQSGTVNDAQRQTIAEQNLPLLKAMNKAVGLYTQAAQKNGLKAAPGMATTINLSGKQRMLTQKMSKEFMLIALGHSVEENKISLQETYDLFDRTLTGLIEGDSDLGLPGTSQDHILQQLDTVDGLWQELRSVMERGSDFGSNSIEKDDIDLVASNNLPLLKEMNAAVQLYEKEASQ